MDTETTTVEIASPDGHDTLELTRDQTMALVEERGDNWVFAGGQMMQPAQLSPLSSTRAIVWSLVSSRVSCPSGEAISTVVVSVSICYPPYWFVAF